MYLHKLSQQILYTVPNISEMTNLGHLVALLVLKQVHTHTHTLYIP